jgi:predicted nucleotidyltransferase
MSLIKLLEDDENSRKIFGKREIKIIEKQLFGVNLTQSEKNRLSRDIRKKFEFISKVSRYRDEFDLKKGFEIDKIIEETKEMILKDVLYQKIKRIILYGSVVENKLTLHSDIDFAVEFTKTNLKESTIFRKRILGKTNKRADIQVYNELPKKIKDEIDKKGRIIYENK